MIHDALFYENVNDKIHCFLCPHNCVIGHDSYGLCTVRGNKGGKLKTINYGEVASVNQDPIEKKPLYHFKPSSMVLSVGSFGCNFACAFCQNYSISQNKAKSEYVSPHKLVEICSSLTNNVGIAFTYNEPTIWYEYVYETSKILKKENPNKSIVLVTDGYIQKKPLEKLLPYVDAMNIDLKSFNDEYYKNICRGRLQPVLETIALASKHCHVEITTLMVNGLNDSMDEIEKISSFIANIDKNIPLHLSRYFPTYKMKQPPTDINVMLSANKKAMEYLNHVYLGNVPNLDNSTYCPECKELLIERSAMNSKLYVDNNSCPKCGFKLNIVF
ncbi:AmmeMemoRadiSam system radical SAM enzyme [Lutibacter sp. B2]|nr:AmmeMemoRadiSam system radical SAM enzyme [Lutibacter sp. B2]